MSLKSPVKAVVFDAFGTIVDIRNKRAPYRQLIKWAFEHGRSPQPTDSALLMAAPVGLAGAARLLGINPPLEFLDQLEQDLHAELSSIFPFEDTIPTLDALQQRGIKLGVCSNLALPYSVPLPAVLSVKIDAYVWSFEAGAIKPDPTIYEKACLALGCSPGEVLFVGDTPEADYLGPIRFGMQALHLSRDGKKKSDSYRSISSLLAIEAFI